MLKVQGLIGLSTDIGSDASALLGNEQNAKTQYFSSVNLNNSTLINYAKRRSAELCRSKWMKTLPTSLPDVICIDSPSTPLSVDTQKIANKTLIVKNGSVKLSGKMANNSDPFTLFIDGGKLLINQEA
ncbi:MAG: hypothetical protein LBH96_06875 [Candidatus Peribacteria bacterium]|nr:hypothetical protein [Candidatus Peribacteria bacterium]